ncbi:hypothetical protein NIES2101_42510 [Calothrix sp. HK-06]|nr:hypothetical protein NIES2101_42510 [Calothrix sp. HK-06]
MEVLDEASKKKFGRCVPSMMWTVSVSESGIGKTRADSVVLDALRKMQIEANRVYTDEKKEYEKALKEYQKNKEEGEAPVPPVLKKHLFEVATIQALYKRLAQQGGEYCIVGARRNRWFIQITWAVQ